MTENTEPGKTSINTRSGRILDFANPSAEAINIADIAGGLAKVPRFGAQAREYHSVAQHAISVSLIVEGLGHPGLSLPALHQDSHEAYACDLPRPLKLLLEPAYSEITVRLDTVIADALEFEPPVKGSGDADLIKRADDAALFLEAELFLAGSPPDLQIDETIVTVAREFISPFLEEFNFKAIENAFSLRHHRLAQGLPALLAPRVIETDSGGGPADFAQVLPSVVACKEVVFSSSDEKDPGGYWISLDDLRRGPDEWALHLAEKRTKAGHRPSVDMLAEALQRRRTAQGLPS